ncbi:glycoside hydrolase family 43 protein [Actinoalloteichus hymeniacidonis]|uniref:Beta-xylosidase n=1 Tax=Actinoalloteichus hymeniacidonis TaxID=340345 RepID=A0AAC9MZB0_9PSEU|nr:glycoside hydrolase family 43 protein [Actinoalloteichus hymeniacidonis]AOS64274.1 putative beta-xylosidase [Actinoalloteichus hymeniacidonis]MBB5907658.1 GH43 family beta-xylosidase [Actinoalloteichus hymeniacidonis]
MSDGRSRWIRRAGVAVCVMAALILSGVPAHARQDDTFRNPLYAQDGADPWLTFHNGRYYLSGTYNSSEIAMRSAPTLAGLRDAEPVVVWRGDDPSRCCYFWAPEFRLLDGPNGRRWYLHYSAGVSGTADHQRMHVLESAGDDPMGPYTYRGKLNPPGEDVWSIDGSYLEIPGRGLYFLWSEWGPDSQENWIAPMSDPWTISGAKRLLSTPQYSWETSGLRVNEAPVAVQHAGRTHVVYSASYCGTPDYKLGLLTLVGSDPLSPGAWVKHREPVFERSDSAGVFGPGHNGFFTSPDGTEDWIVYHAQDRESGGCGQGRTIRAQRFEWNRDGTPNFGSPVGLGVELAAPSGEGRRQPTSADFSSTPWLVSPVKVTAAGRHRRSLDTIRVDHLG